ncbi:MAG TPA: hypothetical protein VGY98_02500 [Verrucomicrobiae bacterium]|nr:hypothetical protein [Verrucomicrobiae bacterium]
MDSPTTIPESDVTAALVDRVSDRVATGVPLVHALAGEPISLADYEAQLRARPDLAALEGVAKRKFIQRTVGILIAAKDSSANIRWLLERLYPEVFGPGRDRGGERGAGENEVAVNVTAIAGMSEEEVRLLREDAKRL